MRGIRYDRPSCYFCKKIGTMALMCVLQWAGETSVVVRWCNGLQQEVPRSSFKRVRFSMSIICVTVGSLKVTGQAIWMGNAVIEGDSGFWLLEQRLPLSPKGDSRGFWSDLLCLKAFSASPLLPGWRLSSLAWHIWLSRRLLVGFYGLSPQHMYFLPQQHSSAISLYPCSLCSSRLLLV